MRDDTLYEDDDVKEALKRLPEHLYNERIFRIKRALDLSLKHQIRPKDQWVKYEEVCVQSVSKVEVLNGTAMGFSVSEEIHAYMLFKMSK